MLSDLVARMKELQLEFKEVHKTVDQLRDTNLRYAGLLGEGLESIRSLCIIYRPCVRVGYVVRYPSCVNPAVL